MAITTNVAGFNFFGEVNNPSINVTLAAGTSRVACIWIGSNQSETDPVTTVEFDGNDCGAAVVSQESSSNQGVRGSLYYYDISDAMGTGSKTIQTTAGNAGKGRWIFCVVINDAATGGPEATDFLNASGTDLNHEITTLSTNNFVISGALRSSRPGQGNSGHDNFNDGAFESVAGWCSSDYAVASGTYTYDYALILGGNAADNVHVLAAWAEAAGGPTRNRAMVVS